MTNGRLIFAKSANLKEPKCLLYRHWLFIMGIQFTRFLRTNGHRDNALKVQNNLTHTISDLFKTKMCEERVSSIVCLFFYIFNVL